MLIGGTDLLRTGRSCCFCINLFVHVAIEEGEKICSSLAQGLLRRFQRSEPGRFQKIKLRGENLSEEYCSKKEETCYCRALLQLVDGGKNPSQQRGSLPVPQVPIGLTNVWYGRPDGIMDPLPSRG